MSKKYLFVSIFLIAIFAFGITFSFLFLSDRLTKIESRVSSIISQQGVVEEVSPDNEVDNQEDGCGEKCKEEISKSVSSAIAKITPTMVTASKPAAAVTTKTGGTTYIPMGTTYTTTSTDWYTINDTAVYIDLINDYSAEATVSWEASLKVAHGNGQAYARLWDDTNKIAVNGSELTTINNSSYTLVSSGNLPFWRGRNLYKVQVKSLNSFEVTETGGKIKISY